MQQIISTTDGLSSMPGMPAFRSREILGSGTLWNLTMDYVKFQYRFGPTLDYLYKGMRNLDVILDIMLEYYKTIPAKSIAMAQGGDFIGGAEGISAQLKLKRKCMNTFICSTDRPFQFVGRINEDVNTYTWGATTGALFLTVTNVSIVQVQTQSNKGGMTDIYLDSGTYIKSFYTIMFQPSSVVIRLMGTEHKRLHHSVNWNFTVPKILDPKYKKL